ncbi:Oidioi.mRNA.OKI2018_I69.PAR.g12349.t1.cds [Oikopleura dioica]|uniref:Oidioi.mRNA.OKI2018_I69.PAR.g12349.t1.cds n=1 Tax=Oikopleura dioica TaxID=34765 RepID=A0ABN7S2Z6_OIKDI|nr:Oidioi.mRNA.OKI2018_I69.PAR.g12349.t1.cds [Oikopleura dioica]
MPEMSAKNGVRKRKFEQDEGDINSQVLELQSKVARLDEMNFLESLDELRTQHERELQKIRATNEKKHKEFLKSQKELTSALTTTESKLSEVTDKISTIVEQNTLLLQRTEKLEAELEAERNKGFINYIKSFFRRKTKTETPPAAEEQNQEAQAEVQEAEASKKNEEQKESTENSDDKKEE